MKGSKKNDRTCLPSKQRVALDHILGNEFFFFMFPKYDEIQCYLKKLQIRYPGHVRLEQIGWTRWGQSIDMIVVCHRVDRQKWGVLVDAGIHAREWITVTSALYIVNYLIKTRSLLKRFDFYIIPCLNPDGYYYTHTRCRLWRKNLMVKKDELQGVDLNRNFPYKFGGTGSSDNPSSFMYRGRYPFSEPESRALAFALNKYESYIKLYISLHTFGNTIMYPWGYTADPCPFEKILKKCGNCARKAMYICNKRMYEVGSVAKAMYITSGCSTDYAFAIHDIFFSFTFELPRGGASGFTISHRRIREVGEEVMVGVEAMAGFVFRYFRRQMYGKTRSDRFFDKLRREERRRRREERCKEKSE